ncbi:acetyltransferase (plasmid) [Fulvitalea axinellae]|uniref:Acetyltransferase n=1 Tax=Fulvitalea axinellae TaxID=1182444 RepID=A0AAU9D090_9BACT|nr:acetyltransferase [Fulvitalea axinellae]
MDIEKYLNRINYEGKLIPTIEVLKELQKNHLLNVPFENLDIHYNNPIDLDREKFYHKIVERKRGGFCYELNGLFCDLLREIGFDSKMISARVYDNGKEDFGREFDHMAIIVTIDQILYLVDVGFGEFTFYPLKIEINTIQSDPRGNFVIEEYESDYYKVSKEENGAKSIEYIFTLKERDLCEFEGMCIYHQTSSNSHFTEKKIISKPTEKGRITISGNTLKITEGAIVKTNKEFSSGEYNHVLLNWFGIDENQIKANY